MKKIIAGITILALALTGAVAKEKKTKVQKVRVAHTNYYVPYDYIDRSFVRISECQPDDSPAYFYYRLILVHGGKEFANLIFEKEEDVNKIHDRLQEIRPEIEKGYIPPADGKRRYFA